MLAVYGVTQGVVMENIIAFGFSKNIKLVFVIQEDFYYIIKVV